MKIWTTTIAGPKVAIGLVAVVGLLGGVAVAARHAEETSSDRPSGTVTGKAESPVSTSPTPTDTPNPADTPTATSSPTGAPTTNPSKTSPAGRPTGSTAGGGTTQAPAGSRPGGTPGPSNTGVPPGTTLTPFTGSHTISKDGTVIDGKDVTGSLTITAKNVVIKNSRIHDTTGSTFAIYVQGGSVSISDTEIYNADNGIGANNWHGTRLNLHDFQEDGAKLGSNVTLESSWIHNMTPKSGAHADGAQMETGVTNTTISGNYIDATGRGTNAALFLAPDLGPSSNGPLTITGNLLDGGGYTLYIVDGNNGQYFVKTIVATNNRFGRNAKYGPISRNVPITQSGNVWDDTGAPLTL